MITTLHIKNIGIIEELNIDFYNGFNVLTGETGAGKTLIIDSIGIIIGERFSKEMIRKGENYSFVEASIYLPQNENAIDGNIIVSREIYSNGRNTCKINGRLVTVNELKVFMKDIIDIHGQSDNQTLLEQSSHIEYLDKFIGKEILGLKDEYKEKFERYNKLKQELKENYGDEKEKQRKLDLLKYQLDEIEGAKLKKNEEEELEIKRRKILNSEKIMENLNIIDENLENTAVQAISISVRALEKLENIDDVYKQKLEELRNLYYEIQELSRDIIDIKEDNNFDESERNSIEERLDLIFALKRKYGNNIQEILDYQKEIENEIYQIENAEERNNQIRIKIQELEEQMNVLAMKINKYRIKYGKILSEKINEQLTELEMKNAKFDVMVEAKDKFNSNGKDYVEFVIATNKGEESKPLIKIASGGEMSRIMLAIKTVLADIDEVPTLIFDEIDTGISGKAANAVGEKIKYISKNHQVLCITHSASIAAKGDYNYYIYKEVEEENTKTKVRLLEENEIINEIARIVSGDITEIAVKHAIELRKAV